MKGNLAVLLLLLVLMADAKGKSSEKLKKEECEKLDLCKPDNTENCVLRCMSENCYISVYGNSPLESGEIDRDKSKLYSDCFRIEDKEIKANKNKK